MNASPVGGSAGLVWNFGHQLADMWQPGHIAGQPTQLQLSARTPQSRTRCSINNDRNNFGPAVGLSWSLPWGGKDKTVVRAGYGISYQGAASFNAGLSLFVGNNPGLSTVPSLARPGTGRQVLQFLFSRTFRSRSRCRPA